MIFPFGIAEILHSSSKDYLTVNTNPHNSSTPTSTRNNPALSSRTKESSPSIPLHVTQELTSEYISSACRFSFEQHFPSDPTASALAANSPSAPLPSHELQSLLSRCLNPNPADPSAVVAVVESSCGTVSATITPHTIRLWTAHTPRMHLLAETHLASLKYGALGSNAVFDPTTEMLLVLSHDGLVIFVFCINVIDNSISVDNIDATVTARSQRMHDRLRSVRAAAPPAVSSAVPSPLLHIRQEHTSGAYIAPSTVSVDLKYLFRMPSRTSCLVSTPSSLYAGTAAQPAVSRLLWRTIRSMVLQRESPNSEDPLLHSVYQLDSLIPADCLFGVDCMNPERENWIRKKFKIASTPASYLFGGNEQYIEQSNQPQQQLPKERQADFDEDDVNDDKTDIIPPLFDPSNNNSALSSQSLPPPPLNLPHRNSKTLSDKEEEEEEKGEEKKNADEYGVSPSALNFPDVPDLGELPFYKDPNDVISRPHPSLSPSAFVIKNSRRKRPPAVEFLFCRSTGESSLERRTILLSSLHQQQQSNQHANNNTNNNNINTNYSNNSNGNNVNHDTDNMNRSHVVDDTRLLHPDSSCPPGICGVRSLCVSVELDLLVVILSTGCVMLLSLSTPFIDASNLDGQSSEALIQKWRLTSENMQHHHLAPSSSSRMMPSGPIGLFFRADPRRLIVSARGGGAELSYHAQSEDRKVLAEAPTTKIVKDSHNGDSFIHTTGGDPHHAQHQQRQPSFTCAALDEQTLTMALGDTTGHISLISLKPLTPHSVSHPEWVMDLNSSAGTESSQGDLGAVCGIGFDPSGQGIYGWNQRGGVWMLDSCGSMKLNPLSNVVLMQQQKGSETSTGKEMRCGGAVITKRGFSLLYGMHTPFTKDAGVKSNINGGGNLGQLDSGDITPRISPVGGVASPSALSLLVDLPLGRLAWLGAAEVRGSVRLMAGVGGAIAASSSHSQLCITAQNLYVLKPSVGCALNMEWTALPPLPANYIETQWPIKHAAMSPSKKFIVASGTHGFCVYSFISNSWQACPSSMQPVMRIYGLCWVGLSNMFMTLTPPISSRSIKDLSNHSLELVRGPETKKRVFNVGLPEGRDSLHPNEWGENRIPSGYYLEEEDVLDGDRFLHREREMLFFDANVTPENWESSFLMSSSQNSLEPSNSILLREGCVRLAFTDSQLPGTLTPSFKGPLGFTEAPNIAPGIHVASPADVSPGCDECLPLVACLSFNLILSFYKIKQVKRTLNNFLLPSSSPLSSELSPPLPTVSVPSSALADSLLAALGPEGVSRVNKYGDALQSISCLQIVIEPLYDLRLSGLGWELPPRAIWFTSSLNEVAVWGADSALTLVKFAGGIDFEQNGGGFIEESESMLSPLFNVFVHETHPIIRRCSVVFGAEKEHQLPIIPPLPPSTAPSHYGNNNNNDNNNGLQCLVVPDAPVVSSILALPPPPLPVLQLDPSLVALTVSHSSCSSARRRLQQSRLYHAVALSTHSNPSYLSRWLRLVSRCSCASLLWVQTIDGLHLVTVTKNIRRDESLKATTCTNTTTNVNLEPSSASAMDHKSYDLWAQISSTTRNPFAAIDFAHKEDTARRLVRSLLPSDVEVSSSFLLPLEGSGLVVSAVMPAIGLCLLGIPTRELPLCLFSMRMVSHQLGAAVLGALLKDAFTVTNYLRTETKDGNQSLEVPIVTQLGFTPPPMDLLLRTAFALALHYSSSPVSILAMAEMVIQEALSLSIIHSKQVKANLTFPPPKGYASKMEYAIEIVARSYSGGGGVGYLIRAIEVFSAVGVNIEHVLLASLRQICTPEAVIMLGAVVGRSVESMFCRALRDMQLVPASMALVALQHLWGPILVRRKFALPLLAASLHGGHVGLVEELFVFIMRIFVFASPSQINDASKNNISNEQEIDLIQLGVQEEEVRADDTTLVLEENLCVVDPSGVLLPSAAAVFSISYNQNDMNNDNQHHSQHKQNHHQKDNENTKDPLVFDIKQEHQQHANNTLLDSSGSKLNTPKLTPRRVFSSSETWDLNNHTAAAAHVHEEKNIKQIENQTSSFRNKPEANNSSRFNNRLNIDDRNTSQLGALDDKKANGSVSSSTTISPSSSGEQLWFSVCKVLRTFVLSRLANFDWLVLLDVVSLLQLDVPGLLSEPSLLEAAVSANANTLMGRIALLKDPSLLLAHPSTDSNLRLSLEEQAECNSQWRNIGAHLLWSVERLNASLHADMPRQSASSVAANSASQQTQHGKKKKIVPCVNISSGDSLLGLLLSWSIRAELRTLTLAITTVYLAIEPIHLARQLAANSVSGGVNNTSSINQPLSATISNPSLSGHIVHSVTSNLNIISTKRSLPPLGVALVTCEAIWSVIGVRNVEFFSEAVVKALVRMHGIRSDIVIDPVGTFPWGDITSEGQIVSGWIAILKLLLGNVRQSHQQQQQHNSSQGNHHHHQGRAKKGA